MTQRPFHWMASGGCKVDMKAQVLSVNHPGLLGVEVMRVLCYLKVPCYLPREVFG